MARRLVLVGAPTSAGSYAAGQEAAPLVLRELGLVDRLRAAGREVTDAGDGPLQVWKPDPAHRYAQNLDAVVDAVQAVAAHVGTAYDQDADVLVIGGNCTVALGVMDALTRRDDQAGLLYIDRHFDLNTPSSTTDGALDWMGIAHALGLPGTEAALVGAFHREPLLVPTQMSFLGIEPAAATSWELAEAERRGIPWISSKEFASDPVGTTTRALGGLPAGPLAVHLDVDALDFIDAPLAENTDGRNSGPTLDAVTGALDIACHDSRFRVLSIGELNPTRAAGDPTALTRFINALATALRGPT
jgi:arginase